MKHCKTGFNIPPLAPGFVSPGNVIAKAYEAITISDSTTLTEVIDLLCSRVKRMFDVDVKVPGAFGGLQMTLNEELINVHTGGSWESCREFLLQGHTGARLSFVFIKKPEVAEVGSKAESTVGDSGLDIAGKKAKKGKGHCIIQ